MVRSESTNNFLSSFFVPVFSKLIMVGISGGSGHLNVCGIFELGFWAVEEEEKVCSHSEVLTKF